MYYRPQKNGCQVCYRTPYFKHWCIIAGSIILQSNVLLSRKESGMLYPTYEEIWMLTKWAKSKMAGGRSRILFRLQLCGLRRTCRHPPRRWFCRSLRLFRCGLWDSRCCRTNSTEAFGVRLLLWPLLQSGYQLLFSGSRYKNHFQNQDKLFSFFSII